MNESNIDVNEVIVSLINIFYAMLLFYQVFMVRSFQKYNDIMAERKKMNVSVLFGIPISLIISSVFSTLSFTIDNEAVSVNLFIIALFFMSYSFLSLVYCMLYFTYQSRAEINRLRPTSKVKWYLDETGFYATIVFVLFLFAPVVILANNALNEVNTINIETFRVINTLISFFMIFYMLSLRYSRKHLEKVKVAYIEVCAAFDLYKEESKAYEIKKNAIKNEKLSKKEENL